MLMTPSTSSPNIPTQSSLVWPVHSRFFNCLVLVHSLTPTLVEVRLSPTSTARFDTVRNAVHQYISKSFETIALPSKLDGWEDVPVLASSVEQITACESSSPTSYLPVAQASLQIHVYQPADGDTVDGFSTGPSSDGEEITAASVCELPSRQWEGLWDSLIFPDDTKSRLLDYIYATVLFSDANVDCKSWLTAPVCVHNTICPQSTSYPGIASYSCMAPLGQEKLHFAELWRKSSPYGYRTGSCAHPFRSLLVSPLIVYSYPHSRLLEINSHSLFSRWFSESGKLVQKLFGSVMDLVEDEDTFVVVLIGTLFSYTIAIFVFTNCADITDEVESLTAARAGAMAGTEPTDALRVRCHLFKVVGVPGHEDGSTGRERSTHAT